jgi:ABC-type nitrate/sulfonate/bicarbonate transport system substrate-binding protein
MTLKDIESVNIATPDLAIALQRRAIDAVFTSSPFTEAFDQQKLAHPIGFPPAGISASGIFFGPTLTKNPDVARAALAACRSAAVAIAGQGYYEPENLAACAKYTKQPVEIIRKAGRYDVYPDLRIDQATVEDMQREFLVEGVLAYKTLMNEVQLVARY